MRQYRLFMPRERWVMLCISWLSLAVVLSGCSEDDGIQVYDAPADSPRQPAAAGDQPLPPPQADRALTNDPDMTWTLPDGWRHLPEQRPMRFATLQAGDGDDALEVAVSAFPGMAGGVLGNVNRWREQFGLPHLNDESQLDEHLQPFEEDAVHGWTLLIIAQADETDEGDLQRPGMLGAIIHGPGHDQGARTWFVRANGPAYVLEQHEASFIQLARSFRPDEDQNYGQTSTDAQSSSPYGAVPPGHPTLQVPGATDGDGHDAHAHGHGMPLPSAPAGESQTELRWQVPDNWHPQESRSTIVYATFVAGAEADPVRITVTPLRGDGGGLLANVNMWRHQVGLSAIEDVDEQPMTTITIDSMEALMIELTGTPAGTDEPMGLMMVVLPEADADRTWFFRMSGPAAGVAAERERFVNLLQSTRLTPTGD